MAVIIIEIGPDISRSSQISKLIKPINNTVAVYKIEP